MSKIRSALARIGASRIAGLSAPLATTPENIITVPWPEAHPASPATPPSAAARNRRRRSIGCGESMAVSLTRLFVQRQQREAGEPVFAHVVVIQVRQRSSEVRLRGVFEALSQPARRRR